jgi:hypothetical protein
VRTRRRRGGAAGNTFCSDTISLSARLAHLFKYFDGKEGGGGIQDMGIEDDVRFSKVSCFFK